MIASGVARTGSVREVLRAATAREHQSVEDSLQSVLGAGPGGYGQFLIRMAAVLPALERAIEHAGIGNALPDWHLRARRKALRQDLDLLGIGPVDTVSVKPARGPAHQLGIAYVLEGSRLGAVLIRQQLPESLPTNFLAHGHGEGLWRSFAEHLETSVEARTNPEELVAGARDAFQAFIDSADVTSAGAG